MTGPKIKRLYYSMSEVSQLTQLRPHILRQWEQRFTTIKPFKNQSGRKLYRPADLEAILKIKEMQDQGYSDAAIEKVFNNNVDPANIDNYSTRERSILREIRLELEKILALIKYERFLQP